MLLRLMIHCNEYAVPFRNRERITFDHLVSMKKPEEKASLTVLREGVEHEFNITLRPVSLVSHALYSPVFSVLSTSS